ncbi:hypothetical protein RND71_032339 [Anisodus tanguticus]|uniref:J domain-containing protein n=1 Tax=Anisodus tanguticus TaxID=243964 RepID=A0AAE1V5T0_9SOLA|nr:hypothetical protein RND71_032339 [Anisodus tanguticus]
MSDDKEKAELEALRFKTLAEQKYNSGDLKSALKFINRAHNLNPTVNGVNETLTAFKILQNDVVLRDYYKILQIERFSHINTIKKQYKKLALILHPDKNTCIGSEEAFKLVNEAFRVLSDKIRRKEYDVKLRIAMQSLALLAEEDNETVSFWTMCSSCRLLHQFDRKYLGHNLMCPSCKESFEAIEVEDKNNDNNILGVIITQVGSQESETTSFWTKCSSCRLLHQFERKYLGHNLMCPSCKESFEAIEVAENGDGDGENVGGDEGLMGTRVSARIKVRKNTNFGLSRNGKLGGKRKMTRNCDEIGVGTEVEREKVRNVDMEGDVESDDSLIKGFMRSRTKRNNKIPSVIPQVGSGEGRVYADLTPTKGTKGKVRNVGEGEDTMTLAEMQMLVKKKVNKEKRAVKDKGEEREENEKAMKFNITEKESEKIKEVDLSFTEKEDDVEMETLIARVRDKRMRRGKGSRQNDSEIMVENEKPMKFNLMEKESEKRKDMDLSLVEKEDEVEMEMLIARVREKRMRREALKGNGLEDGGRRRDLSSKTCGKVLRQDDSEIMAENAKEENEKAMAFNLTEKESEKRKETNLSLIEEEDEVEMETLIARVREKRMRREDDSEIMVENEKAMKLNLTEKGSEEREETNLSLIEEEDEVEMESLIARVKDGRRRRGLSSKKGGKGSRQDDSEIMVENEKATKFNLMEKESEEREESNLSLIEEEDEVEMESPIARVREKRMRCEALKAYGSEDGEKRRDLSIKKGTLSKSSKKGKEPRHDDLEIVAVESFDFYNFDKDRVERSFKKGQVWAVYDDDGMPRDYALIDEVISEHPFEVRMNWLEFQSNSDEALVHWGTMGFRISCGKFKVSRQALVKSLKRYSHVVDSGRAARELYRIYPSKGSIWALYKENAYDIIISLSSYTDIYGVRKDELRLHFSSLSDNLSFFEMAKVERTEKFKAISKNRFIHSAASQRLHSYIPLFIFHKIMERKDLGLEAASQLRKVCFRLKPISLHVSQVRGGSRI